MNTTGDVIAIWYETAGPSIQQQAPGIFPIVSAFKPFGMPWRTQETVFPSNDFDPDTINIGLADCGFAVASWQNLSTTLVMASINENLTLPLNPKVTRCCEKTATRKACFNVLTWCPDSCSLFFNIFCNGTLIAQVLNTGGPLQFVDPICNKQPCHYLL